MTEPNGTNGNGPKVRLTYSPQVSLGNIVTILWIVAGGAVLYSQITSEVKALSLDVCELRGVVGGMTQGAASFQCRGGFRP